MSRLQTTHHSPSPRYDEEQHFTDLSAGIQPASNEPEVEPTERDDQSVCSCPRNANDNQDTLQSQGRVQTQVLSASFCERMREVEIFISGGHDGNATQAVPYYSPNNDPAQRSTWDGPSAEIFERPQPSNMEATRTQLPRVLTLHDFRGIAEGKLFILPGARGDIQAIMLDSVPAPFQLEGPLSLYLPTYNDGWLFRSGEIVSQDVIPESSVIICRPRWLMDGTIEELRRFGSLSICMVVVSKAWDVQGAMRPAYKLSSSQNANVAIAQMVREASQGVSINQAAVRIEPRNQQAIQEALQFCAGRGMQVLEAKFLTHFLFII
ncbi:hypothetical protein B0J12DRAFT_706169 [Macrophomina phaseolina]|uniref:Uncharacterized protein n=1 Tax=Macrophomina phaseolina TaxID=35725 RepID=A0ABQ8FPU8_9PEZI|nr:hypothetical protein B0J12DRAFT_706169 [Macrophomina phaseolina]